MWKACHDILPTQEILMKRKIISDPLCPIYGLEVETVSHILWECPSAMDMWGGCSKTLQKCSFTRHSFIKIFEEIGRLGSEHDIRLFVGLAKQVWLRRNGLIHDSIFSHPDLLIRRAHESLAKYDEACSRYGQRREPVRETEKRTWQAPLDGILKANWDAALNHHSERIGIRMVLRDEEGNVRAAKCMVKRGRFEPSTVESIAAVQTLAFCRELRLTKIQLEGDAKNIVDALNSGEANWSKVGHIIADAQTMM
jgi:hypothetical protein